MLRSLLCVIAFAACTSSDDELPDAPAVIRDASIVVGDAPRVDESLDAGTLIDAHGVADVNPTSDAGPRCFEMAPGYAKQLCLKPWIQELTRQRGAAEALCLAEDLLEQGEVTDCHLLAHFVGEVVFEQQGGDAAQSLVACPPTCLSGCGHQVMQEVVEARELNAVFREQGSAAVDAELRALIGLCRAYEGDNVDQFALCVHGIGHGLLSSGFLGPIEAAELCEDELGVEGLPCASGVFMEHTSRYIRLQEDRLLERLPTICDFGGSHWEDLCWRNVGEALMWFYGHRLEQATIVCNRLSNGDVSKACREGAEAEAGVADMQRNSCP